MTPMVEYRLTDLLSHIVDNRGRSCPTAKAGFPLIATNCVKDDQLYPVFENVRFIDEETYSTWFRAHPEPGDILFVCKGSPGRAALVPDPVPFAIAQDMVALRVAPEIINNRYLYYQLTWVDTRRKIENMHVGTMIPHFKKGDFDKLVLTVHEDIHDQEAIAEVLGALDDKIAANTRCAALIDSLASTVVQRALQTSSPKQLKEIAELTMGSSPKGTTLNEAGTGTVFYQGIRDFDLRYPSNRVWSTDPVRMAEPLDTLLSVRAPVGQTNLATEPTCIGRGIAAVRSKTRSPYVLFHELRLATDAWAPFDSEGTVFGSINKKQLESVLLPTVPQEYRDNLESKLGSMESLLKSALTENNVLVSMRDFLLPQLMSGKLRVKDAEKVVEGAV